MTAKLIIKVRLHIGCLKEFEVQPSTTIGDIIKMVAGLYQDDPEKYIIVHDYQKLEKDKTIKDYGFDESTVLQSMKNS